MTQITASQVKELRDKTGLGMMDCKRALQESNGDIEEAITNLRKSSALKAEKKASRTAVEAPLFARAIPKFAVKVVLPTPPLPEQINIVRVFSATN